MQSETVNPQCLGLPSWVSCVRAQLVRCAALLQMEIGSGMFSYYNLISMSFYVTELHLRDIYLAKVNTQLM